MKREPCPICLTAEAHLEETIFDQPSIRPGTLVECPTCGNFGIARAPGGPGWLSELDATTRGALAGVLRRAVDRGVERFTILTRAGIPDLVRASGGPGTVDEIITTFLSIVARGAPSYGAKTEHQSMAVWASRLFLYPAQAAELFINELTNRGLLHSFGQDPEHTDWRAYQLTVNGWEEYSRRSRAGMASTTAFIASWGDASIAEAPVRALCAAVVEAGLVPIVGVQIAGSNRVTDDIEADIRRSRLVIADFTGGRAGVYWEAGFARGLGLPVVYTCHETAKGKVVAVGAEDRIVERTWREQLHFDTTQFPHIFWSSPEELGAKVLSRIRANGWDESKPTSPR